MTNIPRISIITPSYNQGGFIRETIESILGQNYPNLEYWVIDGGSNDNTADLLREYEPRVMWVSEKDRGQAHAINKGLRSIAGDIVGFINSDDVYLPETLRTVAGYFTAHPEAAWLTGDYVIIDNGGRRIQPYVAWYKRMLRGNPTFRRLAVANYIVQPSTFWRRSLMNEIGLFDESLAYCFDYDFWMRAILKHPLHVVNNPLSLFRIHGASKGGSQFKKQFAEEQKVLKRYTNDRLLLTIHGIHAQAVVLAYKLIK
jgi:glycosyltransferase involved in cell wall biosynthesis